MSGKTPGLSRSKSPSRTSRRQLNLPPEIDVPTSPYDQPTLNPQALKQLDSAAEVEAAQAAEEAREQQEAEEEEEGDFSTASGVDLSAALDALQPALEAVVRQQGEEADTHPLPVLEQVAAPPGVHPPLVAEPAQPPAAPAMARAQFDAALAKLKQAQIFLQTEVDRAGAAAVKYGADGLTGSKAAAEVAIKQIEAKFKVYCTRVQEAEAIIVDLNLPDDQARALYKEIEDLYKAHTDKYIKEKVAIEDEYKKASQVHHATYTTSADKLFKLPTLSIPTFGGDIRDYAKFEKNFNDIIGKTALQDFQKLIHLKQALKGEAAEAVASCGDDDTAYEAAWRILKGRYGDTDVLRSLLLTELADISSMNENQTTREQRRQHDKVRTKFLKLHLVDPAVNEPTSPLVPMIQNKYTRTIRREIEKEKGKLLTAAEFLDEAETILRRENRFAATEPKKDKQQKQRPQPAAFAAADIPVVSVAPVQKGGKKSDKRGGGAGGGATGYNDKSAAKQQSSGEKGIPLAEYTCPICKSKAAHYVSRCSTLLEQPAEERKKTVRLHNLCERCLRKGHTQGHSSCPFKNRECNKKATGGGICSSKKHHPALHF